MKKHHHEQADDEIYMGMQAVLEDGEAILPEIGWRSKRMGQTTHVEGAPFKLFRPLFVKRSEIEAAIKGSNQEAAATLQRMLDRGACDLPS